MGIKMFKVELCVVSFISVMLVVGCTRNPTLVEVGSEKISKKDVEMRLKAMAVFNPQQSQQMALEQLVRSYTLSEVLKKKGLSSLDASVEQEAKRIIESSKSNTKMAQVRDVFGRDEKMFRKVFVMPMLADRLAYMEGYLKDDEFHKAQKQKAEQFLAEAQKSPSGFEALAKKNGFILKRGIIGSEKGLVWESNQKEASSNLPGGPFIAQQWKKLILDSTAPGKVASTMIEQGNMWFVLKNIGPSSKERGAIEIAAVVIAREPFNTWLVKNSALVTINRSK